MKSRQFSLKINLLIIFNLIVFSCNSQEQFPAKDLKSKVQILNVGTFHMGFSSDEHTVDYDEHDRKNIMENREIAKKIAEFKPTIIIVEIEPKHNEELQKSYLEYCKNPETKFEKPSEIELLAYEVGKISNVKKIYGIDHQLGYNYMKIDNLAKKINAEVYLNYMKNTNFKSKLDFDKTNTLDKLKIINHPENLDFLINVNADILTYVSTPGKYEGAEQAAELYKRNLIMFSNLNRIPLAKNDRVFILMGATHTAFFNEFMKRSPRYELANIFEYLK